MTRLTKTVRAETSSAIKKIHAENYYADEVAGYMVVRDGLTRPSTTVQKRLLRGKSPMATQCLSLHKDAVIQDSLISSFYVPLFHGRVSGHQVSSQHHLVLVDTDW